jgi:hypothetical protein
VFLCLDQRQKVGEGGGEDPTAGLDQRGSFLLGRLILGILQLKSFQKGDRRRRDMAICYDLPRGPIGKPTRSSIGLADKMELRQAETGRLDVCRVQGTNPFQTEEDIRR